MTMDVMNHASSQRLGRKRIYERPGSMGAGLERPVCVFWRRGRCTHNPCSFLHCEIDVVAAKKAGSQRKHADIDVAAAAKGAGSQKKSNVWRNPQSGRIAKPSPNPVSKSSKRSGGEGANPPAASCVAKAPAASGDAKAPAASGDANAPASSCKDAPRTVCSSFLAGGCRYGEKCRQLHQWFISDCFGPVVPLRGHEKEITGIVIPSGSHHLYTGSKDGTVRVWDCDTSQCVKIINLECEIGCMMTEGPWIFVGTPKAVKAWNTANFMDLSLSGPKGQVYALEVGNETLLAGTQDGSILAWKSNDAGNGFKESISLTGHQLAVVSLVVGRMMLYSGSMDHTIRVWDLEKLQCVQTLIGHSDVVLSVLCWDKCLLSCSLDQTIKVWAYGEDDQIEQIYTHQEEHGLLALCGMTIGDPMKPVLFCSCNDNSVHVYDLPSFSENGKIFSKEEVRTIKTGPDGFIFTGDGTGELNVWRWTSPMPTAD